MKICHPRCRQILKPFLNLVDEPAPVYALDVGCGIGDLAKNLLCLRYFRIDMFDPDPKAIAQAKLALMG